MTYMYCKACGRVTEGRKTGMLSGSLTCVSCGGALKISRCAQHKCEDCGVILYAPDTMDVAPACPCKAAPDPVEADPAWEETDAEQEYPTISCPRCAASLESTDGAYGPCPVCREIPSRLYVSQQLYHLAGKHKPIQIKWDPKPNEMVYVHHHAAHIPANSLLIVNPNQTAAYVSGGQMVVLEKGQTYALFNEDLDTGAVARAINDGSLDMPPLALKLNTKVIFFDNRKHEISLAVKARVADSEWAVELPVTIAVQVCNAESLLRNALDLNDGVNVSDYLQLKAIEAIQSELAEEIEFIPEETAAEADTEQQVRRMLRDVLREEEAQILERANKSLSRKYGVAIDYFEAAYRQAVCTRED